MIVKGIVSEEELELVKEAIANHGLIDGLPGEIRTWQEQNGREKITWLEIDVNEALINYLERTGFFEPVLPHNRMQYRFMR